MFNQFRGETIFSKIDLRSGYYQVRIKDEYIFKNSFRTRYGHYEFVVMPFGLTNTLTTFMCLMNSILSNYFDEFLFIFINTILIYSKNKQEHEEHLRIILQMLREQQLFGKFRKCNFFKEIIQYLGYMVSKDGISINLKKIKLITEWLVPRNVTDIGLFMGINRYY